MCYTLINKTDKEDKALQMLGRLLNWLLKICLTFLIVLSIGLILVEGIKGCMAKETWEPCGGTKMDTDDILKRVFAQMESSVSAREDGNKQSAIEGVTFLGGEPFEQPEALAEMVQKIKKKDRHRKAGDQTGARGLRHHERR